MGRRTPHGRHTAQGTEEGESWRRSRWTPGERGDIHLHSPGETAGISRKEPQTHFSLRAKALRKFELRASGICSVIWEVKASSVRGWVQAEGRGGSSSSGVCPEGLLRALRTAPPSNS